jgi:hypothetical protein
MLAFFKPGDELIDDIEHGRLGDLLKVVEEQRKRCVHEGKVLQQFLRLSQSRARTSEWLRGLVKGARQNPRESCPEDVSEAGQLVIPSVEVHPCGRYFALGKRLPELLQNRGLTEAGRRAHGYHCGMRALQTRKQRLPCDRERRRARWRQLGAANAA